MYLIIVMIIYHLLRMISKEENNDAKMPESHVSHEDSRHPAEIQLRWQPKMKTPRQQEQRLISMCRKCVAMRSPANSSYKCWPWLNRLKRHTVNVENRVRVPGSTNTAWCNGNMIIPLSFWKASSGWPFSVQIWKPYIMRIIIMAYSLMTEYFTTDEEMRGRPLLSQQQKKT